MFIKRLGIYSTDNWNQILPIDVWSGSFSQDSALFINTNGIYETASGILLNEMNLNDPLFIGSNNFIVDNVFYGLHQNRQRQFHIYGIPENDLVLPVGLIEIPFGSNVRSGSGSEFSVVYSLSGTLAVFGISQDQEWYLVSNSEVLSEYCKSR